MAIALIEITFTINIFRFRFTVYFKKSIYFTYLISNYNYDYNYNNYSNNIVLFFIGIVMLCFMYVFLQPMFILHFFMQRSFILCILANYFISKISIFKYSFFPFCSQLLWQLYYLLLLFVCLMFYLLKMYCFFFFLLHLIIIFIFGLV